MAVANIKIQNDCVDIEGYLSECVRAINNDQYACLSGTVTDQLNGHSLCCWGADMADEDDFSLNFESIPYSIRYLRRRSERQRYRLFDVF
jgi:hypothetical protein